MDLFSKECRSELKRCHFCSVKMQKEAKDYTLGIEDFIKYHAGKDYPKFLEATIKKLEDI